MFKNWYNTSTHYLSVLRYLAGEEEAHLADNVPWTDFSLREIRQTPNLCTFRELSELCNRACCADTPEDLEVLKPLVESVVCDRLGQHSKTTNIAYSENSAMQFRRSLMVETLIRALNYAAWSLCVAFPAIIPFEDLRSMFVPEVDEPTSKYIYRVRSMQEEFPGIAINVSQEDLASWQDDKQMFEALAVSCGRTPGWPNYNGASPKLNVSRKWGKHAILVDGENFSPYLVWNTFEKVLNIAWPRVKHTYICTSPPLNVSWWQFLRRFTFAEIVESPRVSARKSQTDFCLRDQVSRLYYREFIRSFVILSSDSDFGSLCDLYPDAEFNFVLQKSCTSKSWREMLVSRGIPHVYVDESFARANEKEYEILTFSRYAEHHGLDGSEPDEVWLALIQEEPLLKQVFLAPAKRRLREFTRRNQFVGGKR